MTPVERVIATAMNEEGYLEKKSNSMLDDKTANAGSANWTKYARDLDRLGVYAGKKNGYAWCDMFVDWCFIKTFGLAAAMKMLNQPMNGYGAGCTWSANYYKKAGRFHKKDPKAGDQIFFTNDGGKTSNHTGLVIDVKGGRVYTIEGNTSSKAGVVANGGCVRKKSYSLEYPNIYGYGRPDYTIIQGESEEDEDMKIENLTDDQVLQLARRMQKVLGAQPLGSTLSPELSEAQAKGITDGSNPNAFCTRAQAAVMVTRATRK